MDEPNTIEEPGHPEELEQLLAWFRKRGTPLAAGAVILLVLVAALLYARRRAETRKNEAIVMLSSSRSIQDFESIASEHPNSPAAPLAILRAAKGHFDTGSYALAVQKYSEFLEKHADHAMAAAAVSAGVGSAGGAGMGSETTGLTGAGGGGGGGGAVHGAGSASNPTSSTPPIFFRMAVAWAGTPTVSATPATI